MSKKILGLDLGTNSIGWAIVKENDATKQIVAAGSRIIPMDAKLMGDFESGNSISETGARTQARGIRRLYERHLLRRERLNRVLRILNYLPKHYTDQLNQYGQIPPSAEPKIAWNDQGQFVFEQAFQEMVLEFKQIHPDLFANGKVIPRDWTIYYLRKKALSQPISGQELAWILHQFNSKRGYNQSRNEIEDEKPTERKELCSLRVVRVSKTDEVSKGKTWYEIELENGWIYRRQSAYPIDWEGKARDFIVTTKLNEDGSDQLDKEGRVKRSLSAPGEDDWGLRKIKTEHDIQGSQKTLGAYIYDALLTNPNQKVLGQLVRTVDRKFYKQELYQILKKQKEFLPELTNKALYKEAVQALYLQNDAYRTSISSRDFTYLLVEDVLFYQRPLRSKKSLINECPHEYRIYTDENGVDHRQYLKCISKSHPLYEEFRVWQFVNNLRIYASEDELTQQELPIDRRALAEWLLTQKEVDQKKLLTCLYKKAIKGKSWNYVADKSYTMAPTHAVIQKAYGNPEQVADLPYEAIWHVMYSVSDKQQFEKAIQRYASKNGLGEKFVQVLCKQKSFSPEYGAYSEKATRKLLQLMRIYKDGEITFDPSTEQRIEHILTGEEDATISKQVRNKCANLKDKSAFQGLPVWLAEYVVYDVSKNDTKWSSPDDIDTYLQEFRLHSLNNPIVEQVVKETLRVVRDIWKEQGTIDEIHLEMGRDLKLPAQKRKQILQRNLENEKANEAARQKLMDEHILHPSLADIRKYILWQEQGMRSPYTGEPIPFSALYTEAYEIEHVIPQSRYFDDSMTNKVVCEAEVNRLKDRQLGHEFIVAHHGERVTLTGGKVVTIFNEGEYKSFVKETFKSNCSKQEKMLLDEIPDQFIARQLNDSRYISNLMRGLLSNIVREQDPATGLYEPEATSKNLIVSNGSVTDRLKKDWGINGVWDRIILPRFERLNQLLDTTQYTTLRNGHMEPCVPDEQRGSFQKKRIDHRHHAMDAIVIACATRSHVALLSNENATASKEQQRYDLNHKLREIDHVTANGHTVFGAFKQPWDTFLPDVEQVLGDIIVSFKQNLRVINKSNNRSLRYQDGKKVLVSQTKGDNWAVRKPMHKETVFGLVNLQTKRTVNLHSALQQIDRIVEPDLRKKLRQLVIEGKDEKQIKHYFESEKEIWSDINLQKIEVYAYTLEMGERYFASRSAIDVTFDEKTIGKVTDLSIQKILLAHLAANGNDPQQAFSADGIERMNANIQELNGGIPHKPIYKVRLCEKADKFAVGQTGAKSRKFVEAAKGTNLFFAIYVTLDKENKEVRSFVTVPLQIVIDSQKEGQKNWRAVLDRKIHEAALVKEDATLKYILSPGDLVYVPEGQETLDWYNRENIYKMVSGSGTDWYFVPVNVASTIVNKVEYGLLNKISRTSSGDVIKETCIPINVDRLGKIISVK